MDDGPRKNENTGKAGGKRKQSGSSEPRQPTRKSGKTAGQPMEFKSRGMIPGASKNGQKKSYGGKSHGATSTPRSPDRDSKYSKYKGKSRGGGNTSAPNPWIWGWHAVQAVIDNPRRTIHQIMVTEQAAERLGLSEGRPDLKIVAMAYIDKALPRGAAHQGVAVKAAPLQWPHLSQLADDADDDAIILVLDQITDPHNVGAMMRLCSAFGVAALVMQNRKAPPLAGATAKVAVGCLETVPVCLETNIAQTLKSLQGFGYQVIGLAGETETTVSEALAGEGRYAIVMGAEGPGLRELVAKNCDVLARIPMLSNPIAGEAESLNVATAAGIALYEARR
jgi:23S rRNA (guanosine2251-2'-O)-methyltransferase